MLTCGICGHDVDGDEIERRDTGDFHRAGAAWLSAVERGRVLRQRSDALLALSRRLLAVRMAGYPRVAV
jgi:hypothetical protein